MLEEWRGKSSLLSLHWLVPGSDLRITNGDLRVDLPDMQEHVRAE
jgi:hypothetical protein